MAFTTFVDDLALVELLLLLAASILAYAGVLAYWAIRNDRPEDVRRVLKGSSIPLGGIGVATVTFALWGEMTWPFLASDHMAGYNIFFFDPMILFGLVLVGVAISAYRALPLQYVGVFALVAGAATAFYGWTGFTASPQFTKEPFDTFLLYGAFGLSGVLALPTTIVVDHYLKSKDAGVAPWRSGSSVSVVRPRGLDARGAQPVVPGSVPTAEPATPVATSRAPIYIQLLLLAFPVVMALAAFAALWYFQTTLPGHLGGGPAAAP